MKDYFKILGVAPGAPPEVIKAAYRALMKIHHPDVGGDPRRAKEIEEAYRQLSASTAGSAVSQPSRPPVSQPTKRFPGRIVHHGKYLRITILQLQTNRVLPCPRECPFYQRQCRYKQLLSVESEDLLTFKATTVALQVKSLTNIAQIVDFRYGRGVLVDQNGDFYHCHQVCLYQHPPKYKEAHVELFAHTQANLMLWFQQQPPGRYVKRLVYKHRVMVDDHRSGYWDQEIFDIDLISEQRRYLDGKK